MEGLRTEKTMGHNPHEAYPLYGHGEENKQPEAQSEHAIGGQDAVLPLQRKGQSQILSRYQTVVQTKNKKVLQSAFRDDTGHAHAHSRG